MGNGECVRMAAEEHPSCLLDTGGGCNFLSCSDSRGQTTCIQGHCLCQYGSCAQGGACQRVHGPWMELASRQNYSLDLMAKTTASRTAFMSRMGGQAMAIFAIALFMLASLAITAFGRRKTSQNAPTHLQDGLLEK